MVGVEERGYWVSGIGYQVLGIRYWVSGIGYQVLGKWGWEMGLMG